MGKPKAVRNVEHADRKLARHAHRAGRAKPVAAAGVLSDLADQPPVAAICATVVVLGLVAGDRKLTRTGLRMGAAFALTTLTKSLVKRLVDRTRPAVARQQGYKARRGTRDEGPWNSFPSGHTGNAVALGMAVTREYPGAALPGTLAAAAVGAAQLPRGAHYLSDVAAGALVGAASEIATARLFAGRTDPGVDQPDARLAVNGLDRP